MLTHYRRDGILAVVGVFLCAQAPEGVAAQLLGPEFQVNTYITGIQNYSAVAADGEGGFVVVWQSLGHGGYIGDVFAQRFEPTGEPLGTEFQVNTSTTRSEVTPSVAADAEGAFVVVWEVWGAYSWQRYVVGQAFDPSGTPAGDEFLVAGDTNYQFPRPRVAAAGPGNFVVVWNGFDPVEYGFQVFARRFDGTGGPLGSQYLVASDLSVENSYPAVASAGDGGFVVVWQSYRSERSGVFGRRFGAEGGPLGSDFQVASFLSGQQRRPD